MESKFSVIGSYIHVPKSLPFSGIISRLQSPEFVRSHNRFPFANPPTMIWRNPDGRVGILALGHWPEDLGRRSHWSRPITVRFLVSVRLVDILMRLFIKHLKFNLKITEMVITQLEKAQLSKHRNQNPMSLGRLSCRGCPFSSVLITKMRKSGQDHEQSPIRTEIRPNSSFVSGFLRCRPDSFKSW